MDVYITLADFSPPSTLRSVMGFHKGELLEVLEADPVQRQDREWWAARRLRDDAVGYVPSKYLMYEERKQVQQVQYRRHREMHVKKLEAMHQQGERQQPDIYKLPPLEIKSFDEWREENDEESSDPETPEPDYEDFPNGAGNQAKTGQTYVAVGYGKGEHPQQIVEPRKLVNPCAESKERQNLHRELMMNQKRGVDVLNQKSELSREMERRRTEVKKKEYEAYVNSSKTDIEKKLEEQAKKLKIHEEKDKATKQLSAPTSQSEFLRVHSKIIKAKSDS